MEENPSQYVKLKKENITDQPETEPGELSQPVEVPELHLPRCIECGQVLPVEYQPPQNEPWTTAIFNCSDDRDTCIQGAFCPCVLFGRNVEAIKDDIPANAACLCHAIFVEGGIGMAVALASFPSAFDPGTLFLLGEALFFAWWMCGIYTGLFRQELQKKYHLKNAPCDPCLVHCFLHQCALCQEHREMKLRLPADDPAASAALSAPQQQTMAEPTPAPAAETAGSSNSSSSRDGAQVEMV